MSKILRTVVIAMLVALFLQVPCYASTAVSATDDASFKEIIYVETLEKDQVITMEKGKEYIISYPVSSDEWEISKIRLQVKNIGWITIKEGVEDSRFEVEDYEAEQGRVAIKITCKTEDIIGIYVILQNEETKETQDYTFKTAIKKKAEDNANENTWIEIIPIQPSGDDNNTDDKNTGNGSGDNENNDDEEKLIIIDTSGWVFQGVKTVYDGQEYVALVSGLPDYVIPVYQDNKRTNAGSNKAYVTFEVPEGYAVPKGMETDIIIDKATIDAINLDKNWMRTDLAKGTITIQIPDGVVPKGVMNCTYKVNGADVGNSYTITDTGIYKVSANFSLTEAMKDNYTIATETAEAIYNVNPDRLSGSNPDCNILLSEIVSDNEGQKKVCVWLDYAEGKSPNVNNVDWRIRYDTKVLGVGSSSKDESTLARQNEYDGSNDSGYGYSMLMSGYYRDGAGLQTIVFNLKDSDATDIVVNITDVGTVDYMNSIDEPKKSTHGYGIVLNQVSNIIDVTLPGKAPTTREAVESEQVKQLSNEEKEADTVTTSAEAIDEEPTEKEMIDEESTKSLEETPREEQEEEIVTQPVVETPLEEAEKENMDFPET